MWKGKHCRIPGESQAIETRAEREAVSLCGGTEACNIQRGNSLQPDTPKIPLTSSIRATLLHLRTWRARRKPQVFIYGSWPFGFPTSTRDASSPKHLAGVSWSSSVTQPCGFCLTRFVSLVCCTPSTSAWALKTHLPAAGTQQNSTLNSEDLPTSLRALKIKVTQEMYILVNCRRVKNDPTRVHEGATARPHWNCRKYE